MGFVDWFKRVFFEQSPAGAPAPGGQETGRAAGPPSASGASPGGPAGRARPGGTQGLTAAQFAPLSMGKFRRLSSDLRHQVHQAWFARRDRIPPDTEPETLLIDRAMVGQGLITAEELQETHRLGAEMDRLAPYRELARVRADDAVSQDRAARESLKQERKQQAEQRRLQHAEAVARRRAEDIVFLGRGVSDGLSDRRADVERLRAAGLPLLSGPADVARALGLTIPTLRWLCFHTEASETSHYTRFSVPKKSGGVRALAAPMPRLAACQRRVLREVLERVAVHDAAHGFRKGRSTVTNARPHVGPAVVVNMDLQDFFPTITFPRARGVFAELGYSPAAATLLALLCTECPRKRVRHGDRLLHVAVGPRALPQGACTSPALSNLVCRRLDARLSGLARKVGWRYSRYADDLTFSCETDEAAGLVAYLMARVRHIARDEGFAANEKKTRVLRPAAAQTVTGVVVNRRPGVPRALVRRVRAILHHARREGLEAQNRQGHPNFRAWLEGTIAYIHMVNPRQAEPLQRALAGLK